MRHAKLWIVNQHFWTMIGMAILVVLNGAAGLGISGLDMVALGGVVVVYLVFDTLRDIHAGSTTGRRSSVSA